MAEAIELNVRGGFVDSSAWSSSLRFLAEAGAEATSGLLRLRALGVASLPLEVMSRKEMKAGTSLKRWDVDKFTVVEFAVELMSRHGNPMIEYLHRAGMEFLVEGAPLGWSASVAGATASMTVGL